MQKNGNPPPYQPVQQYSQQGYNQNVPPPLYNNSSYQGTRQPLLQPSQGYGSTTQSYSHTTIIQQPTLPVVVVGGCPSCRVGVLEDDYTCLGVCCAIVFFPIGILCCLAMRERRCPNCGAIFG